MSVIESKLDIPAQFQSTVFGPMDGFAKKIERTLKVTIIARDDRLRLSATRNPAGARLR